MHASEHKPEIAERLDSVTGDTEVGRKDFFTNVSSGISVTSALSIHNFFPNRNRTVAVFFSYAVRSYDV